MNYEQEEISLREIIDTLWNGKWLIAIITIISVLIAGIYSYVIADEVYEGKATVSINKTTSVPESVRPIINDMIAPQAFEHMMKSSTVLQQVIEEENLDTTVGQLQNKLAIELPENITPEQMSTFITVKMEGTNQEQIQSIIDSTISITKQKLGASIQSKLNLMGEEYKNKMMEEDEKLSAAVAEFNEIGAGEGLPPILQLQQNTDGTQFILEVNEEVLSDLENLDKTAQIRYEKINEKINNLISLYTFYSNKYDEVESLTSLNTIDMDINVLSEAFVPQSPVAPNKMLNIAIALVIGLMASVGMVFLKEYLKEDRKEDVVIKG